MTASDWTPTRARLAGLFAAVVVGLFCTGLASWHLRASPEQELSGFFQGDMPTYVCYARSAAASPTKLFYSNPHDIRADPARRFVHLPMTLMSGLLGLGVPASWLGMVLRGTFGWLMYFLLARVLSLLFPKGLYFWSAFFLVGLGGGAAWVAALAHLSAEAPGAEFSWSSLVGAIRHEEHAYHWWFLSTFRNLMYPLELIYHSVVFAYLYAAMRQRWRLATSFFCVAALTNPFLMVQVAGLHFGLLLWRRVRGRGVWLTSISVAALWLVVYGWWIPSDPAIASFMEAHRSVFSEPLTLDSILLGYGPVLVIAPLLMFDGRFRRATMNSPALLPILLLGLWTLALSQHSRVPEVPAMQPMHFTRGYLHLCLWVLFLSWLTFRVESRPRWSRLTPLLLSVLLLAVMPDSLSFATDQYERPPARPSLRWGRNEEAVHVYLRSQEERLNVAVASWSLSRQVCAQHDHRAAFGTQYTTPYYAERNRELRALRQDPDADNPLIDWADLVIVDGRDTGWVRGMRRSNRWDEVFCNRAFCGFRKALGGE